MNVEDTNQKTVKCSKCGEQKPADRIVKNRKICKDCCNKKKLQKHKENITKIDTNEDRKCKDCENIKNITLFSRKGMSHICIDCSNKRRREKYDNNEEHRKKAIKDSTEFKKKKKEARDKIKKEELEKLENKIGKDNTICKYCKEIKPKTRFRHNRLKCKDCEKDEPIVKLKKNLRSRISIALKGNKTKRTIEYLGCSIGEYVNWLNYICDDFINDENNENEDKMHIDHVIPLSKFDLEKEEDIYLAFNWRNTMPLSAKENLSKNNKILPQQIKQHFDSLKIYHKDNKIKMPREFIDLYAKHLEAGIPLEP
jgi:hypothetical protein